MNAKHLGAFAWLRWRMLVNRWRRGGALNAVLMIAAFIAAICTAVPLLVGTFLLGVYLIPEAEPVALLFAWDGLVVGFLFFWTVGLVAELQRSESFALSKFLHLPVSASEAFLLNYLSSLLRLSLVFFTPVMLGFALALVYVKGILFLPVLPSVAAFLLMITGLTYQFQGWLAALMTNPRHRRSVVVAATAFFILITQLPNAINLLAPWGAQRQADRYARLVEQIKPEPVPPPGQINVIEFQRRQEEIKKRFQNAADQANRESDENLKRVARLTNLLLPVGWLPLGVFSAAEGRILPAILGLLGMGAIGTASLWQSFRATVKQYRGESSGRGKKRPIVAAPVLDGTGKARRLLVESRFPGLSDRVSVIALAGFRSLVRAPEAKMMLLSPVIMSPILGSMLWRQRQTVPESFRPVAAAGAMLFVLLGLVQVMGNSFGFDRDGFRVFVLSAAPRRDILLGKNLSFAPIVFALAILLLAIVEALCPLRFDHLLALIPQYVSMFLLFCMCANLMSIFAPLHVAVGSLRPSSPKMATVLFQMVVTMILLPLTQAVTLLPLGVEVLLRFLGFAERVPVYLLLSLVECALIMLIYRFVLGIQGNDLRAREQRILEIVTGRAP